MEGKQYEKLSMLRLIGQLKELYDSSAMTWEGLDSNDFGEALKEVSQQGGRRNWLCDYWKSYERTYKNLQEVTDILTISLSSRSKILRVLLLVGERAGWTILLTTTLNREKTTADKIFKKINKNNEKRFTKTSFYVII